MREGFGWVLLLRQGKCRTTIEKVYYDDDDDEYNNITLISRSVYMNWYGILLETAINLIENYLTVNIDKIAEREYGYVLVDIIECFHVCGLGWVVFSNIIAHGYL